MRVPVRFKQIARTVTVERIKGLGEDESCHGKWYPNKGLIQIDASYQGWEEIQTFLHEYFHCALDTAGYPKLSSDERLVNLLADLTLQMMETAEYDE